MHTIVTRTLLLAIAVYRRTVSPVLVGVFGQSCRFTPSCSVYATVAIERHGPFRGSWLALRRLLRCHPWSQAGEDPVPLSAKVQN